jgi:hypothetical protein
MDNSPHGQLTPLTTRPMDNSPHGGLLDFSDDSASEIVAHTVQKYPKNFHIFYIYQCLKTIRGHDLEL